MGKVGLVSLEVVLLATMEHAILLGRRGLLRFNQEADLSTTSPTGKHD